MGADPADCICVVPAHVMEAGTKCREAINGSGMNLDESAAMTGELVALVLMHGTSTERAAHEALNELVVQLHGYINDNWRAMDILKRTKRKGL